MNHGRPIRFRDLPRERKQDLVIQARCIYCGARIRFGDGSRADKGACKAHADLPGLEPL